MSLSIRGFCESDLPTIKRLTIAGFEGVSIDENIERRFGSVAGDDWQSRKSRAIDEDANCADGAIFVAQLDDQIVGYITTRIDEAGRVGYIPNLAVDARFRGQGIGTALIEHAVRFFCSQDLVGARIETLDQNPVGTRLYPALGFEEVARQIHYYQPLDGSSSTQP